MNNIVILDCSIPSSIKERSLEFPGIAFLENRQKVNQTVYQSQIIKRLTKTITGKS
jgi:hypothetical protein